MTLPQFYVDDLIKEALLEDINYIDMTTDYLIPEDAAGDAYYLAKADGVLCGIDVAMRVFQLLDPAFTCEVRIHDGEAVKCGDTIAVMHGNTRALLKGERTALNIVQHMSGIATATRRCAAILEGTKSVIADTRKTLPGLRPLQKYAVACGGGRNHRYNLSDAVMIKDNHIDACGSIAGAVEKIRGKIGHTVKVEVEARTLDEVQEALGAGADIIMLDNMDHGTMQQAVAMIGGRALTEASGNITEENLKALRDIGVDIISSGALTHSVKAFDISMKMA